MHKFKKFLKDIIPKDGGSLALCLIVGVLIIAATLTLLILGFDSPLMYLLYAFSAVSVTYLTYLLIYYIPKMKAGIIRLLEKNKFTNELLESFGYRSLIFAIVSFIINIAYALFHAVLAILSRSIWYGALAIYYIALSLIRGGTVRISRRKKSDPDSLTLQRELVAYRNCGIYLVLLNFALSGAIVQMVISNSGFHYAGLMIYVMATYTFYKLTSAIIGFVKSTKHDDYALQSIKIIGLADSLVSILALQTALLYAFSENYQPCLPNALTGGAVSLVIIAIGIIMIVKGQKTLNKYKGVSHNE